LNQLSTPWALGGTAAANLYAPTLTINPDPAVWIDSRVSASEVAHLLDGELVEKGSNLQLWQSGREAMLRFEILCVLNANQTLEAPDNLIFAWYRCLGHTSRPCMSAEDRLK